MNKEKAIESQLENFSPLDTLLDSNEFKNKMDSYTMEDSKEEITEEDLKEYQLNL